MGISVLISVYKSERAEYLNDAIKSIWTQQTIKPNEIILIKDGPLTPELHNIINYWAETLGDKLVIITNHVNLGLTKSLNKGIDIAKHEFIARMDSDDISHPDRLKKQIEYLTKNPNISVVGGSIQEFNQYNTCIGVRNYPSTHDDVIKYICKASPLAHPAVMIRKAVFDQGIRYNENYRTSQDIQLWFDIINKGYKIANIHDIVLYFRHDEGVFKRRNKSKANNEFRIYMKGIYSMYGILSWRYIFPIIRYIFRLAPTYIIKKGYNSKLRKNLLNNIK